MVELQCSKTVYYIQKNTKYLYSSIEMEKNVNGHNITNAWRNNEQIEFNHQREHTNDGVTQKIGANEKQREIGKKKK